MKNSIKWHQQCARNRAHYIKCKESEIKRLQSSLDRVKEEADFCLFQINTAIAAKKAGFDRDIYLKKLKTKKGNKNEM